MEQSLALTTMRSGELETLQDVKIFAEIACASGFFRGVKDASQAVMKIWAGKELGIPPVAALRGIDLVEGSVQLRAHLIAALIKASGRYDYDILDNDNQACTIEFYRGEQTLGRVSFTAEDAKRAGLTGKDNWRKYTRAMLYNRAMSEGARMYCPDVFMGPVYYDDPESGDREIEARSTGGREAKPALSRVDESQTFADMENEGHAALRDAPRFTGDAPVVDVPLPEDDDIPDAKPPAEAPSPKQIGYCCALMKERGVQDNDSKPLLELVFPGGPSKSEISELIDTLMGSETLPEFLLFPYIRTLRESKKVSYDYLVEHLQWAHQVENPLQLNRTGQIALIRWLCNHKVMEEEPVQAVEGMMIDAAPNAGGDEVSAQWEAFLEDLVMKTGFTQDLIEPWILHDYSDYASVYEMPLNILKRFQRMGVQVIHKQLTDIIQMQFGEQFDEKGPQ